MAKVSQYQSQIAQAPIPGASRQPYMNINSGNAMNRAVTGAGAELRGLGKQVYAYGLEKQKQEVETDLLAQKNADSAAIRAYVQDDMYTKKHADARNSVQDAEAFLEGMESKGRLKFDGNSMALEGLDRMYSGMRNSLLNQASNYSMDQENDFKAKTLADAGTITNQQFNNPDLTMQEREMAGEQFKRELRSNAGQVEVKDDDGNMVWQGGINVAMEIQNVDTDKHMGHINILLAEGNTRGAKSYLEKNRVGGVVAYDKADVQIDKHNAKMQKEAEQRLVSDTIAGLSQFSTNEERTVALYELTDDIKDPDIKSRVLKDGKSFIAYEEEKAEAAAALQVYSTVSDMNRRNLPRYEQEQEVMSLLNTGTIGERAATTMLEDIAKGGKAITPENVQAEKNAMIKVDEAIRTNRTFDVQLFARQNDMTHKQAEDVNKYQTEGGFSGQDNINYTQVNRIFKNLKGQGADFSGKDLTPEAYQFVLQTAKQGGGKLTDENIAKLIARGMYEGETTNSGWFFNLNAGSETAAEALANERVGDWTPSDIEEKFKELGVDDTPSNRREFIDKFIF